LSYVLFFNFYVFVELKNFVFVKCDQLCVCFRWLWGCWPDELCYFSGL